VSQLPAEHRGHGGRRKRPPLVLPALIVPDGVELAEFAVAVREAAELMEVSFQSVHQMIERHAAGQPGGMPGYLWQGRKFVLIEDMAESRATQRLRDRDAEIKRCRGLARYYAAKPDPHATPAEQQALVALWEARAEDAESGVGAEVEGPAGCAAFMALERVRAGLPPLKPTRRWDDPSGTRRAQLSRARAVLAAKRAAR
jgi:hypothetical protein